MRTIPAALVATLCLAAWTPALSHEPQEAAAGSASPAPVQRHWLAGDHHVHSRFSVGYAASEDPAAPPTPVIAGDARYPIPTNAQMGLKNGLSWMVSTDHGGPHHSKVNQEQAYPELVRSRQEVPGLIQFYGMEFDTPGADHSSLIVPHTHHEHEVLFEIESRFSKREPWPADPTRDSEPNMLKALEHMKAIEAPPVVIANHPSRSAKGLGEYGLDTPLELRDWNDTAPQVAVGMEGAPGHQAGTLNLDGSQKPAGVRGAYRNAPTMGGFDQMTARLGGFWDSMLGEGRRWWVTSTSDSHRHYTDGGSDFWPGEYSKTYVLADRDYDDILDGIRHGRVFVTTGDLVSEVDVTAAPARGGKASAGIGGALSIRKGQDVRVTIRVRDPAGANHGGRTPDVARIDLIRSEITGPVADRSADANPNARVEKRFTAADWTRDGEVLTISYLVKGVTQPTYLRVRGTNGSELEPAADPAGENPWDDLWFYTNPVFLELH